MSESSFNIKLLSNKLEKYNIESNSTNCYLFLIFFLERCQLISSIITAINPEIKNSLAIGIKYCIINEPNYDKIIRKIKEFKNDIDKNDFINELIKFIRTSIEEKKNEMIKSDSSPIKLNQLFNQFVTIKLLMEDLDCFGFENNEIQDFIQSEYNLENQETKKIKLQKEIDFIQNNWEKYKNKSEIYSLLKNWFIL